MTEVEFMHILLKMQEARIEIFLLCMLLTLLGQTIYSVVTLFVIPKTLIASQ
jgi:hypothetical protein